ALYVTYCLVFMEHVLPFPRHWLLQAFYLLLPPLGFVVILDGIVQFSYHLLRRDESGKEWVQAMAKTLNNHVILCGLGKVGFRVLEQLLRLGQEVAVLEKNPQCPNLAYARSREVPVLIGNGREAGIFEELNLKAARSIILATDDDLANLEMALDARKIKPGIRVVMRMYDQELAAKIRESFDIHLAFSTSELSAPLFATSSTDRSILNSFYVDDRLLVVALLHIQADSQLLGQRVGDLRASYRVLVLSHARSGQVNLYPEAQTLLQTGDRITVQTEPPTLRELHRVNRDPEPY
ncbi:MAG: NAD-binding protein, partial [Acidobacteria bacterium]|nr:NAD-binding protein [Acidobacteriota bacterium]